MVQIESGFRPAKLIALAFVSLLVSAAHPTFAFNCHVDPKVEHDFYWSSTPAAIRAKGDLEFDTILAETKANRAANGQADPNGIVFLRRPADVSGVVDVSATPVFLGRAGGNSSEDFLRYTCGNVIHPFGDTLEFSGFQRGSTSLRLANWAGKQLAYRNWLIGLEAAPETWPARDRAELRIDAPKLDYALDGHDYTYLVEQADIGILFNEAISGGPGAIGSLDADAMAKLVATGDPLLDMQARRVTGLLFTDDLPPEDPKTYPAEFADLAAAKPGSHRSLNAGFRPQPVNVAQTPYYYGSIIIHANRPTPIHNHNGLGFFIDGNWTLHAVSIDGAEAEIDLRSWISRQSGKPYYMGFEITDPVIDVDMGSSHIRLVASLVFLDFDDEGGPSVSNIAADVFSDDPTPPVPAAKT